MAVRIVTDSSAGLPPEVIEELDITVLNLHVLGGESGDDEKAAKGKKEKDTDVSTSGLSSLELVAAYARQLERGGDDGVVALHLSKDLSSTYLSAVTAAGVFDDTVRVVDTGTVGMAVGAAAMAAASLAQSGASLDACETIAQQTLEHSATWVYLHRIDELRRSGRMSTGTAIMAATLLAIKPIMEIRSGKLELAGKTRTQTKAFSRLVEFVVERAEDKPAFVAIQHNDAEHSAIQLRDLLEEMLPEGSSFMVLPLTEALAVHTGSGAVGVSAVFTADQDEYTEDGNPESYPQVKPER